MMPLQLYLRFIWLNPLSPCSSVVPSMMGSPALRLVVERALAGKSISDYLNEKLW